MSKVVDFTEYQMRDLVDDFREAAEPLKEAGDRLIDPFDPVVINAVEAAERFWEYFTFDRIALLVDVYEDLAAAIEHAHAVYMCEK